MQSRRPGTLRLRPLDPATTAAAARLSSTRSGLLLGVVLRRSSLAFLFPLYWMVTGAMKSPDELAQHTARRWSPTSWQPQRRTPTPGT